MAKPIYFDTCGLKEPVTYMHYAYGCERTGTLTESVCADMCKLSISPNPEDREAAALAALTIHKLKCLPTVKLIYDRTPPLATHTDNDLMLRAQKTRGRILTADRKLQERARSGGVGVIAVQELWARFRAIAPEMTLTFAPPAARVVNNFSSIARGEALRVKILEQGEGAHQGIGYLPDGRKVVVNDGIPYKGTEIDIVVQRVLQTSGGEMIFAIPVAPSNGNGHMGVDL